MAERLVAGGVKTGNSLSRLGPREQVVPTEYSHHRRGEGGLDGQREKHRLAFEAELNSGSLMPIRFPPETRLSEEHRREFLAYDPSTHICEPLGWLEYLQEGAPSYIVA